MQIDEETLRRNRKFAIIFGSISSASLIMVMYILINFFPNHVELGILIYVLVSMPVIILIGWRRRLHQKKME